MTDQSERTYANQDHTAVVRPEAPGLPVPGVAEVGAGHEAFLAKGGPGLSRLLRTDGATRAQLITQFQRTHGNGSVQRVVAACCQPTGMAPALQRLGGATAAPTPASLATTPAGSSSSLGAANLARFQNLLISSDKIGALRLIAQVMGQRGEIDAALMATQAVSGHSQAACQGTDAYILDPSVNGANTGFCGSFQATSGNRVPNPRIRVNFDSFATTAATTPHQNAYHEFLAELLHSTLLHEYRHVLQEYARCNATGASAQGICTDCNSPDEMDAYLAEIEAGYSPNVYRRAWVRVYVNWSYLAPEQQAVFAARRSAAQQKINTAFPGVDWAADPAVATYTSWCQALNTRTGGNTRGACSEPLAPLSPSRPGGTGGGAG